MFSYGPHPEFVEVITGLSLAFIAGSGLLWVLDEDTKAIAQTVSGVAAFILLVTRLTPRLWPLPKPHVDVFADRFHVATETITNPNDDTTTSIRVLVGQRNRHVLPFKVPFEVNRPFRAELCTASWRGQTRVLWLRVTPPTPLSTET